MNGGGSSPGGAFDHRGGGPVREPAFELREELFWRSTRPGLPELRRLLEQLFGKSAADGRLLGQERLKKRVYRLRVQAGDGARSVIVKWLHSASLGLRNQLVVERWLPALGLGENGPALLGVAAESSGRGVWHVYEDFGDRTLEGGHRRAGDVAAAIEVIAGLHVGSAGHAQLPEYRRWGYDLGPDMCILAVSDAMAVLESTQLRGLAAAAGRTAVLDRLLERMTRLWEEGPERSAAMRELGGSDVLLHGDLWPVNVLVVGEDESLRVRLIDWDNVAAGTVAYDLSTLLAGFPERERRWILDLYREAVAAAGWLLPSPPELNFLFSTAEWMRWTDCLMWRALALLDCSEDWAWDRLAAVEQWAGSMEALLPAE